MGNSSDSLTGQEIREGRARVTMDFIPSSYSAIKSATTTVTGQSEALATGATAVRLTNLDATNYALFAFGTSAANAESNAASGATILATTTEFFGVPVDATHYAWLGDTGTVLLSVMQGA